MIRCDIPLTTGGFLPLFGERWTQAYPFASSDLSKQPWLAGRTLRSPPTNQPDVTVPAVNRGDSGSACSLISVLLKLATLLLSVSRAMGQP